MSEARCRQQWRHTASVIAVLVNLNRDPKKGEPVGPDDFDPYVQHDRDTGVAKEPKIRVGVGILKTLFVDNKMEG